ncbi:MAG: hypothetical protein ABIO72_05140 [Patescibacteria group bacterium]
MERRTLFYSVALAVLGIAIAVVVVLILRKRAMGPEYLIIPSVSTSSVQAGQAPPQGTQTGEPTKPHNTYQTAPAWKEGDGGHAESFFQLNPFHPFERPSAL